MTFKIKIYVITSYSIHYTKLYDDNAILRNYLYPERYNIISALNGREALELIESRNIDLILLDLIMPVMDGFEFLEYFSKTRYYCEIPVIVASSLDKAENIEKVLESYDIYDYVIKPLDHINRLIVVNKIRRGIKFREMYLELQKTNKLLGE